MFKIYLVPLIGVCKLCTLAVIMMEHFSLLNCLIRQYRNEFSANLCRINLRQHPERFVNRVNNEKDIKKLSKHMCD